MIHYAPDLFGRFSTPYFIHLYLVVRRDVSGPIGPYFPKIGQQQKLNGRKLTRNTCGELNMTLHPNIVDMIKVRSHMRIPHDKEFKNKFKTQRQR